MFEPLSHPQLTPLSPSAVRLVSFYFRTAKGEEEVFKTTSKDEAKDWILCIKTNSKIIDNNVMKSVNQTMNASTDMTIQIHIHAHLHICFAQLQFPEPFSGFEEKVLKMGWIREKTLSYSWKWRYMILTDYAVYLYEKAPVSDLTFSSRTREITRNTMN